MSKYFLIEESFLGIIDILEFLIASFPDTIKKRSSQTINGEYLFAFVSKVDHDEHPLPLEFQICIF